MYTSAKELLAACEESGLSLAEMTLRHECDKTGTAREDYLKGLKAVSYTHLTLPTTPYV